MNSSSVWALVLAAGQGSRLAEACNGTPKQFLTWQDAPLWWHSAKALAASPQVKGLIFIFPPSLLDEAALALQQLDANHALGVPWKWTAGGQRRQDSVYQGLQALPPSCTHVLIHDSARPFIQPSLCQRVLEPVIQNLAPGAVPGTLPTDTIKETNEQGMVIRTPDRARLRAVQTPQAFQRIPLCQAHEKAQQEQWEATDDAMLMERAGHRVMVVEGERSNLKITVPEDLAALSPPEPLLPCSGLGYDVHRFGGNRPLILGGVPIPGNLTVSAHSDGDVLLHALMDAILGCAALGDIGRHFPDTDERFAGMASSLLLYHVLDLATAQQLRLCHVDLTIVAQKPRLGPHAETIKRNVARLLSLPLHGVNMKATTEEGLGFTGDGSGLKAFALVSALRPAPSVQRLVSSEE